SKAAGSHADVVVLDLEDSVAPSQKEMARELSSYALKGLDFGQSRCFIRINQIGTPEIKTDLKTTLGCNPDGYVLPKSERRDEIEWLDHTLEDYEAQSGLEEGTIQIFPIIETAKGVLNLEEIVSASPRVCGLAFGGEDLAASIGAKRSTSRRELFFARSKLVIVAAAYDLPAIDTVFTALRDSAGLQKDAQDGADLGFSGKLAIHPNQLDIIHRIFSPSEEMIAWARDIKREYERLKASGIGVFTYQGQMIDEAHLKQAERILRMTE
ncbi:MAG: CoA ester lyase, partial [Chloroflexota bacterium]